MNRDVIRQIVTVTTAVLMITANILANALPINNLTTGEISDSFPVLFVPAGYVFSIWGVIYLGIVAFMVYQALPAQRENPRLRRAGYWFALGSVANSIWIFLWHYQQFALSLVAMLVLLASLILSYLRLDIGRVSARGAEKWAINAPFSIYLGWITVATVANVTVVLYDAGWNGFGLAPQTWAVIMLIVATVVAALVIFTRRDVAYSVVIIWAFVGIVVKQAAEPSVAITAGLMAGVVLLLLLGRWFMTRLPQPTNNRPLGSNA